MQRKRPGFATVQLSTTEFLGKRDTDKKKSFSKRKPANMLRLSKMVIVQEGMPVITGIHVSVVCVLSTRKRLGGEPKKRKNSMVVAKTLDHTQAEWKNHFAEIQGAGRLSARSVRFSGESKKKRSMRKYCQEVPTVSNFVTCTTRWTQRSKSECFTFRATRKLCRFS